MNATAYVRVSTRAQDHATQRSAIERAASARGDTITRWYEEKRSAKTMARDELRRLRNDARAGHVRRLYVFRIDRLARSGIRDTFEVVEEFRAAGVEIVTIADGFSLDGPAADVVLAVMAWAAKAERLATAERIAAARERIEAEGGRWGRPSKVDDATRARAAELRAEGKTVREIARTLHVPRSTIARAIGSSRKVAPQGAADRPGNSGSAATS
jgi:DNA invertase Pin-like site-specific DNA recombinase